MKDETRYRFCTVCTIVIVLLVLAGGLVKLMPRYHQYIKLQKEDAARDVKLHEIELKNAEYTNRQRLYQTNDEELRLIARENGRYHPNEIVVIFGDKGKQR